MKKKNIFKKLGISVLVLVISIFSFMPFLNIRAIDITTKQVYFVWRDGNDYHYHLITVNKNTDTPEGITINPTFIKLSDIVSDKDNTTKFNINNQQREVTMQDGRKVMENNWEICDKDAFEAALANGPYENADALFENHVQDSSINPLRSPLGKNSLYHDGDHEFRLIIYNDEAGAYSNLVYGVTNETRYVPSFWDEVFYPNIYDVTGTTKENPVVIESYVLENTISLGNGAYGAEFTSIKALDVPAKAVTIQKVDNKYKITFNSNAYDKVVFEIKDANNKTYYVLVARISLKVADNFRPGLSDADSKLMVNLFYPSNKSYSDYEVVANITYNDGKTETKTLTAEDMIDDSTQDNLGKNVDGGVNLKQTLYTISNGKSVKEVRFFVKKAGSTADVYGGTFSGSNKGLLYNVDARSLVYMEGAN